MMTQTSFPVLFEGINVAPVLHALDRQPKLWDSIIDRANSPDSPHRDVSDIWVRYNAFANLAKSPSTFNDPHIPVWYPAWQALPELRPIVFDLMARLQGEVLGGILITKVPAGKSVHPHIDRGWHVEYYDKFYVQIQGSEGCEFCCDDEGKIERFTPKTGQVYLFDNRMLHWVDNKSDIDRITLIVCIRTQLFGRT